MLGLSSSKVFGRVHCISRFDPFGTLVCHCEQIPYGRIVIYSPKIIDLQLADQTELKHLISKKKLEKLV